MEGLWDDIVQCIEKGESNILMHENAQRTGALNPRHKYVPWIVVNGKHTEKIQSEAQEDLMGVILRFTF